MKKWILLFLFPLASVTSIAQSNVVLPCDDLLTSAPCDNGWLSMGLGLDSEFDFGLTVSANYGRTYFWQLALQSSYNFCEDICDYRFFVSALNASRGISFVHRIGRAAFSAGPALVWGRYDENYDSPGLFLSAGIVGNIQLIITPLKETGFGLDAFVNMNPVLSTYGLRVTFVIEGHK